MKKFLNISFGLVAALMTLTACNDDDNWTPGPADTEIGVNAYFPSQSSMAILSPENPNYTITIDRVNATDAISLPITVVSSVEGVECPATIDFAAGQSETTLVVNFSKFPSGEFHEVTFELPADHSDIYGPGMDAITLSVIVSEWKQISDNVTYYYTSGDLKVYPNTYGEMYHLDKTNYFKFTDFFASGLDVMFDVTNKSRQEFLPRDNAWWTTDSYGYNIWYLYNEAEDDFFSWYPDPSNPIGIYYYYAYADQYSWIYMLYNTEKLYGYASICGYLYFTDETYSSWMTMQIDFNLKYNPFE